MKIIIVGGGTAGWLTAAHFELLNTSNFNSVGNLNFDVTVIESPDIPIIGAGEGATGILFDAINGPMQSIGTNHIDFLYETQSTPKLGIRFKDWNGEGTEFLSPLQPSKTVTNNLDIDLLAHKVHSEPHNCNLVGRLLEQGLSTYLKEQKQTIGLSSYHFDAHKVGEYFKNICVKRNTKYLQNEVVELNKNSETGFLESVILKDGTKLEADFWIDCSGFSKVLTNQMGGGWHSYSEYLPVNSALPYLHKFEENEIIKFETLAWAMPNGWQWQIPTQERYGCGYVYSDMFTNADKALAELERTTGRSIDPIRNIKFDVGRLENFWTKNVVAIGLSSGFLEPLQATSIHTTIVQIQMLLNVLDVKSDMEYKYNSIFYNNYFRRFFDDNRDLMQIHYMGKRNDSDFWKFCHNELKKTDKVEYVMNISKHRSPSFLEFEQYHGASSWAIWCWTVFGLDLVTKETAYKQLKKYSLQYEANRFFHDTNDLLIPQVSEMMSSMELLTHIKNKTLPRQNIKI
jgi:tryptophan halogenase